MFRLLFHSTWPHLAWPLPGPSQGRVLPLAQLLSQEPSSSLEPQHYSQEPVLELLASLLPLGQSLRQ